MTEETQEHNNLVRPKSGTATSSPRELQHPQLFNVCWFLRKNGYSESTVKAAGKRLKHLMNNAGLKRFYGSADALPQ